MKPLEIKNKSLEELRKLEKDNYKLYEDINRISVDNIQVIFDECIGPETLVMDSVSKGKIEFHIFGETSEDYNSVIMPVFPKNPVSATTKPTDLKINLSKKITQITEDSPMTDLNRKLLKISNAVNTNEKFKKRLTDRLESVFTVQRVLLDRIETIKNEISKKENEEASA